MEDLKFKCQARPIDTADFKVSGKEVYIRIKNEDDRAELMMSESDAAQLRDWLNEFLGDACSRTK